MTRNELLCTPVTELTAAQVLLAVECKRMGEEPPTTPERRVLAFLAAHGEVVCWAGESYGSTTAHIYGGNDEIRTTKSVLDRLAMRGFIAGTAQEHSVTADCFQNKAFGSHAVAAPAEDIATTEIRMFNERCAKREAGE